MRLHTDEGLVGLGETFMGAQAVEAHLHEWAAPHLLGKDPLAIEARNRDLAGYLGWRGAGAETRGNSAIDIALWDLFGKAAGMADAWQLPVAPHDCTGPVVWAASTHLSLHAPNALIQESVRAFCTGWYQELVTALPQVHQGMISLTDAPGLGLELQPGLDRRADAIVRSRT